LKTGFQTVIFVIVIWSLFFALGDINKDLPIWISAASGPAIIFFMHYYDNWAKKIVIRNAKPLLEQLHSIGCKTNFVKVYVVNRPWLLNSFSKVIFVGEYRSSDNQLVNENFIVAIQKNKIIESDVLHKRYFEASIFEMLNLFKGNLKEFYRDILIYDQDCRFVLNDESLKVRGIDYIEPLTTDRNGNLMNVKGYGDSKNIVTTSLDELRKSI